MWIEPVDEDRDASDWIVQNEPPVGVANGKSSEVLEDGVISLAGTKVHFEGGTITSEDKAWTKDNLDCDLWKDLLVCNTARYSVVLKKSAATPSGDR